jgi:hypothetical protein
MPTKCQCGRTTPHFVQAQRAGDTPHNYIMTCQYGVVQTLKDARYGNSICNECAQGHMGLVKLLPKGRLEGTAVGRAGYNFCRYPGRTIFNFESFSLVYWQLEVPCQCQAAAEGSIRYWIVEVCGFAHVVLL